jgi:GT2 family glycosyltransferase
MNHMDRLPAAASVAVVLVNWNGWRDTVECIDTILTQDHGNLHIFVVDNDSADGSIEHIVEWCAVPTAEAAWLRQGNVRRWSDGKPPRVVAHRILEGPVVSLPPAEEGRRLTLVRSGGNLGFAGACNVAVRAAGLASFDFFWFLNNDSVIASDALSALLRRACADTRPGMTGSTVMFYDAPHDIQVMGGARMDVERGISRHIGTGLANRGIPADGRAVEQEMDYVMGASMLVSRDYIREVGLMSEDYFLYYEEIDWAIRGRGKFDLAYAPQSHVFHKAQASGKKALRFSTRFFYRNRIRFSSRFYPQHLSKTKRGMVVEMMRHLARGRWTHVHLIIATLLDADRLSTEARQSSGSSGTAPR